MRRFSSSPAFRSPSFKSIAASSRCARPKASESSASQRARSTAGTSVGTLHIDPPPTAYHGFRKVNGPGWLSSPFWSRNRLTFLQNAGYQYRARSRISPKVTVMDAYLSNPADLTYSDEPPILITGSSEAAMARAERCVAASGLRIGAKLPIALAGERLAQQGSTRALWIELDQDCGGPLDDLLDAIARDVREERYAAIISTPIEALDAVAARINEAAVEIIVNPSDAERVAALATAVGLLRTPCS